MVQISDGERGKRVVLNFKSNASLISPCGLGHGVWGEISWGNSWLMCRYFVQLTPLGLSVPFSVPSSFKDKSSLSSLLWLTCAEKVNKSNLIEENYTSNNTLQLNQIEEQ